MKATGVKLQASVNNYAIYFFSSITGHIWILLVILLLHKPPALLKSWNKIYYPLTLISKKDGAEIVNTLFKAKLQAVAIQLVALLNRNFLRWILRVTIASISR